MTQTFADGHVLETSTNINCIGEFTNKTGKGSDYLYIDTRCRGQFEQVQVMNLFEPYIKEDASGESLAMFTKTSAYYNSYTCRSMFFYEKQLTLSSHIFLSYLHGNGDMTCKGSQSVKIQKDYCKCTKGETPVTSLSSCLCVLATCAGLANEEEIFQVDPSAKQSKIHF